MKILLTGANGYIGKRLMPFLLEAGYKIVALICIKGLIIPEYHHNRVLVIEGD